METWKEIKFEFDTVDKLDAASAWRSFLGFRIFR